MKHFLGYEFEYTASFELVPLKTMPWTFGSYFSSSNNRIFILTHYKNSSCLQAYIACMISKSMLGFFIK